jgi:tRNA(fMet)-specific endonuclease VapC
MKNPTLKTNPRVGCIGNYYTGVDTSTLSNRPENVLINLKEKRFEGIAISTITLSELSHGVENSSYPEKNTIALMKFLSIIDILPFDANAALEYGKIKTDLKKRGCLIGHLDMLIAAHAKSGGFILVTNNIKEFERIKDLQIENWAGSMRR